MSAPTFTGHIKGRNVLPGDVMLLPFNKTATVDRVKLGIRYVELWLVGLPKTRIGIDDDVLIERKMDVL